MRNIFKLDLKTFLTGVSVLVAVVMLGYLLSFSANQGQVFQAGLEAGREEVREEYERKIAEAFPSTPEPEEIFSISGKIGMIEDDVLVLTYDPSVNPFDETKSRAKVVMITGVTKIVERVPRCAEELAQEDSAPVFYNEVEIRPSRLKMGDKIIVVGEEDIKGKIEFAAQRIILNSFVADSGEVFNLE